MRLSDLKKKLAKTTPPVEDAPLEDVPLERAAPPPERPSAPKLVQKAPPPAPAPIKPAPVPAVDPESARRVYGRAVDAVRAALATEGPRSAGVFPALADAANAIADNIKSGDQALLVWTGCSTPADPAVAHSVNVAIFSAHLAAGLGWNREELVRLALAALLHDISGRKSYRLGLGGLSAQEEQSIRFSLKEAPRALDQFDDAPSDLKLLLASIISQLHKTGPEAPPDAVLDKIQLSAQIVTLCDLYEAMTRGRDKAPMLAQLAFKHLLGVKERFGHVLVKRLIEQLSPFPPGSLIQLADGRVGCVVKIDKKMLTRPLVDLWLESDGKPRETPKLLNLAAEPLVAVLGPADESKVAASGVAEKLEALRTWRGS